MSDFTLSSPAFDDGERIPDEYGYTERNANPPLSIGGAPESAGALVLIVDDPDAEEPAGTVWDHWLVWDVDPDRETVPEDWSPTAATEGQNDYGEHGYGGPNPPDREHTYRFRLYAVEEPLGLSPSADTEDLVDAMTGQVVGKARLEGTYPV
ncbi:YbhB/YbcL family Raf kinase inhibitor-like protein [Halorubrum sp. BOL3-1]|uniref:YbhB/YbcL family Raf kinase inhibitor-like protein n=1 Tax=Halorubrum sp. BOL3-1 TaxID=2497325 RepID=UPI001004EB4E|nr:YbhB/YbcL family Raf kinase inhibitor-like protein [Halorubrum sp. BOL3-1]QAU13942.1 YbhB/YbcL family Raf kinase inhibitor-like protein [Halorubrum sp. BOL3-1]